MKSQARPVYLDLPRIRLPLPGWVSILHRASGLLLFLALPAGVWMLSVSLQDAAGFASVAAVLHHPLVKLALVVLAWAFAHHLLAGLRHLALDAHWGVGLRQARFSSLLVLTVSGALALAFAGCLFQ